MSINFDESFRRASELGGQAHDVRSKLIESVLELNKRQKINKARLTELAENQAKIDKLKADNKELKMILLRALIERDELDAKRTDLSVNIERLTNQLENLERESDDMVRGDQIDHMCEQFSIPNQVALLNKIHDARNKLIKNGFPSYFFA